MPTTSESRLIAAPPRVVILSGVHARSGHDDSREGVSPPRAGIWGGATSPFSQTNYRQMLTPSTPPSFHPARLSMTR
ncbi:MAG: hypothetical protein E3J29_05435 [Dehalococcoidia bacterium]|nr:MAG: hypothetical protein E3J29_05435 [Dehalococcoidia bacterium]